MNTHTSQPESSGSFDRLRLRLAIGVLLLFVVTVFVVDKRTFAWPTATWPMYSLRPMSYPEPTYTGRLYFASDDDGNGFWVRPNDLWGADRYSVTKDMIARGLDAERTDARDHLVAAIDLIRFKYPNHDVTRVEIWELTWNLDLDAVPSLIFETPDERTLLATFSYESLGVEPWERRR